MRKLCILLLALLLACPASGQAKEQTSFLVLVYLCGTDLESDGELASDDLQEMLEAELEADGPVQVLVQAGGARQWRDLPLKAGESRRFLITDTISAVGNKAEKLDMGAPETLRDFVGYALDEFSADRYALVLWDHGSGASGGVCYDELTENSLTAAEIHGALSQALAGRDEKFSFIGFDACLMSTFEVAAYVQPFADYMIASEELEPGSGWAYDRWLNALASDPAMDDEAVGRVVVDSFVEVALQNDPTDYVTLAVTDLNKLDSLRAALEDFGSALNASLETGNFATIARARAGMRAFGDFAEAGSDMVDIADVAWECRQIAPDKAEALTSAAKGAVVYSRNSANIRVACGLSILLPDKTKEDAPEYMPEYDALQLMPEYTDFVNAYLDNLQSGNYVFAPSPIQTMELDMQDEASTGWFAGFLQAQQPSSGVEASWGDDPVEGLPDMTQEDFAQVAQAYGNSAHVVQLSQEDLDNLSYVEAALLQDALGEVGDAYGDEAYFDFGLMQDVYVDWDAGTIYGMFDGNWPTLEGQMVPMFDQIVSEEYTRSLIPARVNGEEQYLLVVFNEENPYGTVVGYSAGYDANGNPARGYQKLKPGDQFAPLYDLIYWDDQGTMQTEQFEGEAVTVTGAPPAFGYEPVEPGDYSYAFCLNDIFGDYQFTDFVQLSFD